MSVQENTEYCYVGSAEEVCHLNIKPIKITLDCVPCGEPTKPYDILLGGFIFGKWDGTPDDFWIATQKGTAGDDVIDGNGLLASIEAWSGGTVAQTANGTYLGDKVYFQICGEDGNDTITGGANWDVLYGGNGNDTLNGLGGSDELFGDCGNDVVNGGDGDDHAFGGDGDDVVNGGNGCDLVVGGAGKDSVNGNDGNDTMFGDADGSCTPVDLDGNYYAPEDCYTDGADRMDGGIGNDTMFGQGGNDVMLGGLGDDGMDGGSGNDNMRGGLGIDNMTGGCGDDKMNGDAGNDLMNGGDGADCVNGGAGNDWIAGGKGDDVLIGGAGKDVFVFCEDCGCEGDDWITDFSTLRPRDQIDLTQMENLDLVISTGTGDAKNAHLDLISFGEDGCAGGGDDYTLGTIDITSAQNIEALFGKDTTFGTSATALVRVDACVIIDLPSDSFVYNGEFVI